MMRLLILFMLMLLLSCSQKTTAPVQQPVENAKPEGKGAVPFAETLPPENIQVVTNRDIPYFESHVKIAGNFDKRGNFDILETGLLYSQMHSNLLLGNVDVFRVQGTPDEGSLSININMFAGADLYVRAYAVNRHGVGYGNTIKFVLCQRPIGLQSYGAYYAAIDKEGKRYNFHKDKNIVRQIESTWLTESTIFQELRALVMHTPNIAVGAPVYVNDNNSCSTLFDGYYLIDKVPLQTIYIQKGRIAEVFEGLSDYY